MLKDEISRRRVRTTSTLNFHQLNLLSFLSPCLNRAGWAGKQSLRCNSIRGRPRGSAFRNAEKQTASETLELFPHIKRKLSRQATVGK